MFYVDICLQCMLGVHNNEAHQRPPTFQMFAFLISQFHCRLCTFAPERIYAALAVALRRPVFVEPDIDIVVEIDGEILLHHANIIANLRALRVSLLLWTGYFVTKVVSTAFVPTQRAYLFTCSLNARSGSHFGGRCCEAFSSDRFDMLYRNNLARHKSATTFSQIIQARMQIHTVERLCFVFGNENFHNNNGTHHMSLLFP